MILCVAARTLPGIRPCTHHGQHDETCPDPDTCTGCLPHAADGRGYLCFRHWEQVQAAYAEWPRFQSRLIAAEGRLVSPDNGGIKGSAPSGYSPLTLTTLTLDECERLLKSLHGKTLDVWVHDPAGARDAVLFAHAAENAYRSLEVEQRPAKVERARCPHCFMLAIGPNPTRVVRGVTEVYCQWPDCGKLLDTIRDHTPLVVTSEACESGVHHSCPDVNCRCDCHLVRDRSLYTVSTPAHLLVKDAA